jgi:beta-lactamase superfamily II metal-dependent hydrolase
VAVWKKALNRSAWVLPVLLIVELFGAAAGANAQGDRVAAQQPLTIYVTDTEGGKTALWIAPSGQTVLIDSGSPGTRDLDRLMDVVAAAGVTRIDYLISTHYHVDHVGGLQELVKRIPVGTFVDHGPTVEGPIAPNLREQVPGFQAAYAELWARAKHLVVKPGDTIPVAGLDWKIVASAGAALKTPIAGAPGAGQPNRAACAQTPPKDITTDPENGQSVGSLITLGRFRAADFGDLLWNNEVGLMCPDNPLGTVALFMVTHHGLNASNSPAMVHGLKPRVAVMQNGTNKGAAVDVMQLLRSSPGLEDIWQLHWSYTAGIEHNAPGVFIANLEEPSTMAARLTAAPGGGSGRGAGAPPHVPAYWIKVTANANGSFTVVNSRNNFSKTYNAQ